MSKPVQRNFVVSAPRQALQAHYRLDGTLPFEVGEKLFSKQTSMASELRDHEGEVERKILQNFFKDSRLLPGTREQVAKAVLKGDYEMRPHDEPEFRSRSPVNPSAAVRDAERRSHQLLLLNRHSLPKPHFMELITESTAIPLMSPKLVREESLNRIRRQRALQGMTASSSAVLDSLSSVEAPLSPLGKTAPVASQASQSKSLQSKQMMEDKKCKIAAFKRRMQAEKAEIKNQKALAKLTVEKKVELKKKLGDVRRQIKGYLDAKNDPMRGDIMRCIDETMIFHFLEKYDGMSMSAGAILALIGNSIGSAVLTPDLTGELPADESQASAPPDPGAPTAPSAPSAWLASQSMEMSHNSMINNYKAFGQRLPSPMPPSLTGGGSLERPQLQQHRAPMEFTDEDDPYTLEDHFRHAAQTDAVEGIQPRRYVASRGRPRSSSPERTLASGFRVSSARADDAAHMPKSPSMVLMSSEHLRRVASEMGFDMQRPVTADDVLRQQSRQLENQHGEAGLMGASSHALSDDVELNSRLANEAIAVMHEQLLEEELLPSLRPERVLSPAQLEALGEKKKTWDDIFREVSRQGPRPAATDDASSLGDESVVRLAGADDGADEEPSPRVGKLKKKGSRHAHMHPPAPKLGDAASQASSRSSLIEALLEGEENMQNRMGTQRPPPVDVHRQGEGGGGVLVYPVSPTHHGAASPTKPVAFFGSLAQTQGDKQRLYSQASEEQRKAEERLVLPALRPPEHRGGADIPPMRLLTMSPEEFANLHAPMMAKGPRALKSRGEALGNDAPAKSPFESWTDEMAVLNRGIPAGAGLRLYRPHADANPKGRYRSSHGSHTALPNQTGYGTRPKPFVSAA